jgi:hypothetical protein
MAVQTYPCPSCHEASEEPDFCSACGKSMTGVATPSPASSSSPSSASSGTPGSLATCPTCGTDRPSQQARFCEVCRYDFVKNEPGAPPVLPPAAADPATASTASSPAGASSDPLPAPLTAPSPTVMPAPAGVRWDVLIAIEPNTNLVWEDEGDGSSPPDPPQDPERRIPLDLAENLIGRRDEAKGVVPEIRPHDLGVSRRHAKLLVHPDGSVAILDLDSSNGTFVNDVAIMGGVTTPLAESDVVRIGYWTRLQIMPRAV